MNKAKPCKEDHARGYGAKPEALNEPVKPREHTGQYDKDKKGAVHARGENAKILIVNGVGGYLGQLVTVYVSLEKIGNGAPVFPEVTHIHPRQHHLKQEAWHKERKE